MMMAFCAFEPVERRSNSDLLARRVPSFDLLAYLLFHFCAADI